MKYISIILVVILLGSVWAQDDGTKDLEEAIDSTTTELTEPLKDSQGNAPPADSLLDSSYVSGFVGNNVKKIVMDYIKENPFSKLSHEQVRNLILSAVKDKPAEKMIENFPKAFDVFVIWLRDTKALPALLSIVNRPRVVKNYGIAVVVVFILSFGLNLLNTEGSLLKRIMRKFVIMGGALFINTAMAYIFFKPELQPTLDIIFINVF